MCEGFGGLLQIPSNCAKTNKTWLHLAQLTKPGYTRKRYLFHLDLDKVFCKFKFDSFSALIFGNFPESCPSGLELDCEWFGPKYRCSQILLVDILANASKFMMVYPKLSTNKK